MYGDSRGNHLLAPPRTRIAHSRTARPMVALHWHSLARTRRRSVPNGLDLCSDHGWHFQIIFEFSRPTGGVSQRSAHSVGEGGKSSGEGRYGIVADARREGPARGGRDAGTVAAAGAASSARCAAAVRAAAKELLHERAPPGPASSGGRRGIHVHCRPAERCRKMPLVAASLKP